jgi:hypothetical protein
MAYNIADIKNLINTYISSTNVISLGEAYAICLNNQNELFVENIATLRKYPLDDVLLCINEDVSFFEALLPEYVIIHKLLKQWYYDAVTMEDYYV